MDKRGIGELLLYLRQETHVTQEQLCQGLCSVSQIARMEKNQLEADCFLLDRLFCRMGKSVERLEYVLSIENYELYRIRQLIQESICHKDFVMAEYRLEEYQKMKSADRSLHRQYIAQERAQIAWIRGERTEEVLYFLQKAISETMPLEDALKHGMLLSAEELKLLLFRWEVCQDSEYARDRKELEEILKYLQYQKMEAMELVKVFPYAALLMGKVCKQEKDRIVLEVVTRQALSLLREEGKILYMPEILEQYTQILKYRQGEEAFIKALQSERDSILAIEKEYGVDFGKYRLFNHIIRRFEIDSELIRKTRLAVRMTQEELSNEICAQETLSRIESGKQSPSNKKLNKMLEKMGRKRARVSAIITTDQYEILKLKQELSKYAHWQEYKKAGAILDQIEKRLDGSFINNVQYIQTERIKVMYHEGRLDWETCLKELKKLLSYTLKWEENQPIEYVLTVEEINILTGMALIYAENGEEEKALQIYQLQVQKFSESYVNPVFHILEWETAMSNLATSLNNMHDNFVAIKISKEKIGVSLEAGKGNSVGRSLITMASALEQQRDESCVKYFELGMDLLKLYKMEIRYKRVINYVYGSDFPYKEKLSDYYRQGCQYLE